MELRLDSITPEARDSIGAFFEETVGKLGRRLHAGVVSGEALLDSYVRRKSPISVMLVVDQVDPGLLHLAGVIWRRHAKRGFEPPLVMGAPELARSLDSYPVEFLSIKLSGAVVCGDFDLHSLDIRPSDLRLQCERELRGLLIHTRMAYLQFGQQEKRLGRVVAGGTGKLMAIVRAVAFLLKGDATGDEKAIVAQLEQLCDEEMTVLLELFALRLKRRPRFTHDQLVHLGELLVRLVDRIDRIES